MTGGSPTVSQRDPYPHAPIVEAVIDIRVAHSNPPSLDKLAAIAGPDYPVREELFAIAGQLTFGGDGAVSTEGSRESIGFAHKAEDGLQVWQSRLNGFSFSRLAPYDRWERFRDEALRLWEFYEAALQPATILRLGARYINRIALPAGPVRLEDYLRTYPELSSDLPQTVSGFFFTVQIPMEDRDAEVHLVQTIVEGDPSAQGEQGQALILDISAFRDVAVEVRPPTGPWLSEQLESLRDAKNQAFEASITDTTRERFY